MHRGQTTLVPGRHPVQMCPPLVPDEQYRFNTSTNEFRTGTNVCFSSSDT
jgi:hypothetical protein